MPTNTTLLKRLHDRRLTDTVTLNRSGTTLAAQRCRHYIERQEPTDPDAADDTPLVYDTLIGDSTLDVEVGDTYTYEGILFTVIQGATPSTDGDWKRKAVARGME